MQLDITTTRDLVLSGSFGHETAKRMHAAAKKHCFLRVFEGDVGEHATITVAHLPSERNVGFRFTGNAARPFECTGVVEDVTVLGLDVCCSIIRPYAALCDVCWRTVPASKKCVQCNVTNYCSMQCQREHWPVHKTWCKAAIALDKSHPPMFNTRITYTDGPPPAQFLDALATPSAQPKVPEARIVS